MNVSQCNVFLPCVAILTASFLKKTKAIETAVVSDCMIVIMNMVPWKKKVDVQMFFFPFLCSGIPDLTLGILKMLICVCFLDVLKPAVYWFARGMIWLSASLHIKCTIFTVSPCFLQVLAMYKKVPS